ncbi:MAG TPA: hypothetical protein PLK34_00410 [Candidatus Pacearchaeota archaeon]|nr:hypothetical protein [Candidatus Pacearchaeota archaeon]
MKKRGIVPAYIIYILIALAILLLVSLSIGMMRESGLDWIGKIKGAFNGLG